MYNNNQNNQGMNNQQGGFQQQPQGQNQQYANNVMNGSFTAESAGVEFGDGGGNFNRNSNIQPVPDGTQIASIYKVLDIGTHIGFKNELKRQIKVFFEFPQYCQQFDLDKPDFKPSVVSQTFNFFTGSKAKLRQLMQAVAGRNLSDQEAAAFDFQSLLGQLLVVTINHKPSTKDPNIIYANPTAYTAINPNMIIIPQEFNNPNIIRNPITAFYLGKNAINLTTPFFANLPLSDRKNIIASQEAQSFLNSGGVVFRNEKNEKDNFYPGAIDNGTQQNAQQNGFTPINQNTQMGNPNNQQGGFQQQQPNNNFGNQQPSHAFGQSAQQAMGDGQFNNGGTPQQQPNQNFQQQPQQGGFGNQNQNFGNQQSNNGGFNQPNNNFGNQEVPQQQGVPTSQAFGNNAQGGVQQQQGFNQQGTQQAPQQDPNQQFPGQGQQAPQMENNGNGFQQQQQPAVDNSFSQSQGFSMEGEDDLPF